MTTRASSADAPRRLRFRTRTTALLASLTLCAPMSLAALVAATPLALVLVAAPADAQQRPRTPYQAVVTVPEVEVRSGAGKAFYPVGLLEEGAQVVVRDEFLNWYRIDTPEGVTCFILAKDVEVSGDGDRGVVVADQTYSFLAGMNRGPAESFRRDRVLKKGMDVAILNRLNGFFEIEPPAESRAFLPPGTLKPYVAERVAEPEPANEPRPEASPVAADDGGTDLADGAQQPPRQTADGAGSPLEPAQVSAPAPRPDAEIAMAVPAETSTAADVADAADAVNTAADRESTDPAGVRVVDRLSGDAGESVRDDNEIADSAVAEVEALDVNQLAEATEGESDPAAEPNEAEEAATLSDAGDAAPPVTPVQLAPPVEPDADLATVEAVMLPMFSRSIADQPLDEMARAYASINTGDLAPHDQRVVQSRLAMIERNRDIQSMLTTIQATQRELPVLEPVVLEPAPGEGFAAVGILRLSRVFGGADRSIQTYRVVDPTTERTLAYVRPTAGVDPAVALGQVVGVRGRAEFDPSLNTTLITATGISPLTE